MNTEIHHALVIEGDHSAGINWAKNYIVNTLHMNLRGNPDVNFIEVERYTIKNARDLKIRANKTPFGKSQVFIIQSESILHEAQNALLKLFEEPANNTYFLIVIPTLNGLLDTVRSRIQYGGRAFDKPKEIDFAQKFIKSTIGTRIKMLEPILKLKDRKNAREILDAVELQLHSDGVKKNAHTLKEIYFIRQYISNRSSSLKMLLEHLAISM